MLCVADSVQIVLLLSCLFETTSIIHVLDCDEYIEILYQSMIVYFIALYCQGGFGGIYVNTSHAKLGDRSTQVSSPVGA